MISLELVSLTGVKVSEDVYEVLVPTPLGQIAIFPDHMPLVSMVVPGVISVRRNQNDNDESMEHYASHGGVVEITRHRVRILVDEAVHSDEVIEAEAQAALARAKELLKGAKDQIALDQAEQLISVHQARLRVAELRKRRSAVR